MPRSSKSKASATGVAKSAKGQARASSVGKRATTSSASGRSTTGRRGMSGRHQRVKRAALRRRGH